MEIVSASELPFLELDCGEITMNQGAVYLFRRAATEPMSLGELRLIIGKSLISKNLAGQHCLRQRVVEPLFSFANPRWLLDPHFDINHQVCKLTFPGAATWQDLLQIFAEISVQKLDRGSPMWRVYLVCLADNPSFPQADFALLTLSHKALASRLTGSLLSRLIGMPDAFSRDTGCEIPSACVSEALPSRNALISKAKEDLMKLPGHLRVLSGHWIHLGFRSVLADHVMPRDQAFPKRFGAPKTPFNRCFSFDRVHGSMSWPRAQLSELSLAYKDTDTLDVLLLITARLMRIYLLSQNNLPGQDLVALTNRCLSASDGKVGHLLYLPTTFSDPGSALRFIREQRKRLMNYPGVIQSASTLAQSPARAWVLGMRAYIKRRLHRLHPPAFNLMITIDEQDDVSSPDVPWILLRQAQFGELYPGVGLHLNFAISSDQVSISFSSTTATIDTDLFQDSIAQAKAEVSLFMQAGVQDRVAV